jgi:hypothetical protein
MDFTLSNYKKLVSMFNATKEDHSIGVQILKHIYGTADDGNINFNDDSSIGHQLIIKSLNNQYSYKSTCALPYQFRTKSIDDIYDLIENTESENKENYKLIYSYVLSKMLTEHFSDYQNVNIKIEYKWD